MENPSHPVHAVTAGEALIDLVEQPDGSLRPHAGGAVYNLTRALALQGTGTAYLNALSADRFGTQLRAGLQAAGVALARPDAVREPTSLAIVAVDDAGKPDYAFHREGVADRVGDAQSLIDATRSCADARLACTGCLALLPEDGARYLPWLRDCRGRGLLVAVDANLRPAVARDEGAYRASVRAALALADIIKVSDDDLALLSPAIDDPLQAAAGLFDLGPVQLVALTRGAAGATLLTRDGRRLHARERDRLRIVDTVGAGDCFLAGLLSEIVAQPRALPLALPEETLQAALRRAVASASLCVQQAGCVPPGESLLREWIVRGSIELS